MAQDIRIINLPTADTITASTYLVGDNMGSDGTVKITYQLLGDTIANNNPITLSNDTTDSNISTGMTNTAMLSRIKHLLDYIYLTNSELTALETALGINT